MEWQPIETVPLGEFVLVFGEPGLGRGPKIGVARIVEETTEWWEQVSPKRQELQEETKRTIDFDAPHGDVYSPTHWMPLPAPPTP